MKTNFGSIKLMALGLFVLFTLSVKAQKNKEYITVTGKVQFVPDAEHQAKFPFVLKDGESKEAKVFQTIKVNNDGTYSIKVPANPPRMYSMDVFAWDRITFWAGQDDLGIDFRGEDTAKMKIKNPPYVYIKSNGDDNKLINLVNYETYQTYQNTIAIGKRQYMAMQSKDTAMTKSMTDLMMDQYEIQGTKIKLYTDIFKNDPQVIYALKFLSPRREQDYIFKALEYTSNKYPWLTEAKTMKADILNSIAVAKKTELESKAMDFTQNDVNGKPINLNQFIKNKKYVLIDFWASWCGPCRQENPNVVKAYDKYKDKGFEILGVSLDDKKENWLKAIKDDRLAWPNVSDLKGWKNEVAVQYNIRAVPSNFLIDNTGKIVAKNLRAEDLHKKLAELFKD